MEVGITTNIPGDPTMVACDQIRKRVKSALAEIGITDVDVAFYTVTDGTASQAAQLNLRLSRSSIRISQLYERKHQNPTAESQSDEKR